MKNVRICEKPCNEIDDEAAAEHAQSNARIELDIVTSSVHFDVFEVKAKSSRKRTISKDKESFKAEVGNLQQEANLFTFEQTQLLTLTSCVIDNACLRVGAATGKPMALNL